MHGSTFYFYIFRTDIKKLLIGLKGIDIQGSTEYISIRCMYVFRRPSPYQFYIEIFIQQRGPEQ